MRHAWHAWRAGRAFSCGIHIVPTNDDDGAIYVDRGGLVAASLEQASLAPGMKVAYEIGGSGGDARKRAKCDQRRWFCDRAGSCNVATIVPAVAVATRSQIRR